MTKQAILLPEGVYPPAEDLMIFIVLLMKRLGTDSVVLTSKEADELGTFSFSIEADADEGTITIETKPQPDAPDRPRLQ